MILTGQHIDALLKMFPDGADVIEGREEGHIHAQGLYRPDDGRYRHNDRGVLIVHAGRTNGEWGCIGISRDTYFRLPADTPAPTTSNGEGL